MLLKIKNLPIQSNNSIYSKCLNQDLWEIGHWSLVIGRALKSGCGLRGAVCGVGGMM
jgi:hypothetical protein